MTMTNRHNRKSDCFIFLTIEEMVPQNHLVRKLEKGIDFRFIYPKVEHLYSKVGKPSIDPVVLFKLLILNIVDGNNSMRKTCERAQTDMAYRWFLGVDAYESIPNYSTWSQNYIRRYKDSTIFNEIFDICCYRCIFFPPRHRYVHENNSALKLNIYSNIGGFPPQILSSVIFAPQRRKYACNCASKLSLRAWQHRPYPVVRQIH